jgi:transcriptional regulator with XRE-family HTH domain
MEGSSLTPISCRMGRAALDWTLAELAAEANVAVSVIRDYEHGRSPPHRNNLAAIVRAFEHAGVEFPCSRDQGPCATTRSARSRWRPPRIDMRMTNIPTNFRNR